jgi:hypothetical protein
MLEPSLARRQQILVRVLFHVHVHMYGLQNYMHRPHAVHVRVTLTYSQFIWDMIWFLYVRDIIGRH